MREVIIIGGGLAGLVSAILLKRQGKDVLLIEKKKYPFHRVCGEYVSNEVKPFLQKNGLFPNMQIADIDTFGLSSTHGTIGYAKLDLGGFGISRYAFDNHLFEIANSEDVETITGEAVKDVMFENDFFSVMLPGNKILKGKIVIGAFGKRANLDQQLKRKFFFRKSPYIGVKYHAYTDHPSNVVALHNFAGGYCGINGIENGKTNICYLSKRENLRSHGNIAAMEQNVLRRNPQIERIFGEAEFLFEKPEVINEISFETKEPVENHLLMCGDAAGMITPLCGNGMAMAIHSAKMVTEHIDNFFSKKTNSRYDLEKSYAKEWNANFKFRLWYGRQVQRLFGNKTLSNLSVNLVNNVKPISKAMIKSSHGRPM